MCFIASLIINGKQIVGKTINNMFYTNLKNVLTGTVTVALLHSNFRIASNNNYHGFIGACKLYPDQFSCLHPPHLFSGQSGCPRADTYVPLS